MTINQSQPAVSLVLVVLILGSLLTAGLLISETLVRQGQVTRATSWSELAYYAAESGIESLAYRINKLEVNAFGPDFSTSDSLPNGSFYNLVGAWLITNSVPWSIPLTNQSFQLDFNLNINYPSSLSVNASNSDGEVILFSQKRGGGEEEEFINTVPPMVSYNLTPDRYYQLKIRNPKTIPMTLEINASSSIPTGFELEMAGFFKNFQRKIRTFFPKFFYY